MKKLFFLAATLMAVLSSCTKDNDNVSNDKAGIFKGPVVRVHAGKAWTWMQLNNEGNLQRLAVTLTDEVLNSVPVGGEETGHDHAGENTWTLQFHPRINSTVFNHVGMGWNPIGHEPEFIYGKPHFDFHFYMITPQAVNAIPAYEADSLKFKNWPAPAYFPPTYFNPGGGVPKMGAHWIDFTSPELNGQPFTQTYIYGSYDGKVTFQEPMITLDFLKNNNNFERPIPQAAKVQKTGYYPTKLRVVKHDGVTDIILDEFVYRQAS